MSASAALDFYEYITVGSIADVPDSEVNASLARLLEQVTNGQTHTCWFEELYLTPLFSSVIAAHLVLYRDTLQHVILAKNDLGDAGLEPLLAVLMDVPNLSSLDLSQTKLVGESTPSLFALIVRSSSLQRLSLDNNPLGNEFCLPLCEALKCNVSLLSLTINEVSYWSHNYWLWKSIQVHPRLREFHANRACWLITCDTAEMLANLFLCTPALEILNLANVPCEQKELRVLLEGLRHNTTLKSLYVGPAFELPKRDAWQIQDLTRDILVHNVTIEDLPVFGVGEDLNRNLNRKASRIKRARRVALILTGLKRFRRVPAWGLIGRDVIKILGTMILATKLRPEWEDPQLWPVEDKGHWVGSLPNGHPDAPRRPTKRMAPDHNGQGE